MESTENFLFVIFSFTVLSCRGNSHESGDGATRVSGMRRLQREECRGIDSAAPAVTSLSRGVLELDTFPNSWQRWPRIIHELFRIVPGSHKMIQLFL